MPRTALPVSEMSVEAVATQRRSLTRADANKYRLNPASGGLDACVGVRSGARDVTYWGR